MDSEFNAKNEQPAESSSIMYDNLSYLSDIEAEKQVLGLILIDNKVLRYLELELNEDSFYYEENKLFFKTIKKLIQEDRQAEPKTLYYSIIDKKNELHYTDEQLKEVIDSLIDYAAGAICKPIELVNILNFLSTKRALCLYGKDINDIINSKSFENIDEHIGELEKKIYEIVNKNQSNSNINHQLKDYAKILADKLQKARKSDKTILGLSTGLKDLDNYTGGLQKSDLIIIAARPSMGKTALATTIARNVARILQQNHKKADKNEKQPAIAMFSLEMSGEQLAARIVAMESGFSMKTIHTGRYNEYNDEGDIVEENKKINEAEWKKINKSIQDVSNLPLYIDDTPALNVSILRSRARYMKDRHNVCAIIIDYLQLLRASKNYGGNRVLEVSEITSTLKAIAKELNIPVIALSQLSRAVEKEGREDKKPQLSDLRESGTIEQDADIVMLLYREEYYEARREPKKTSEEDEKQIQKYQEWKERYEKIKNIAEIIVAKNRNGPVGTAILSFDKEHMVFTGLDKHYYNAMQSYSTDDKIEQDKEFNQTNNDITEDNSMIPPFDEGDDSEI